ncbi:hypothetical protein ACFFJT_05920 [Dyella flava]|uniref:Dolichyl-phosphate-mannose-protein mannosyltransferase n=1 Tax=Dyella flava TaxID=1920170 RepID=A0ABS2K0K2_9GAMM|nr:hypothetical protein [Dyella flava]MBM7124777.1 hypothetical protein [Dyella flava]GLQ50822.1 hypothetical protein GCM10010872_22710 [Dyella flava]
MDIEGRNALATRIVLLCLCFLLSAAVAGLMPIPLLYVDGITILQTRPNLAVFGSSYEASAYLFAPLFDLFRDVGVRLDAYGRVFDDNQFIVNVSFGALFFAGIALQVFGWRLRADYSNTLRFAFFTIVLSPFFFCISKELLPAWLAVAVLMLHRSGTLGRRGMFIAYVALMALCGLYFRVYYLLFAALLPLHWMLDRRRKLLALVYLLGAVVVAVAHNKLPLDLIIKGRADYLGDVSNSRIQYLLPDDSGIGFIGNRFITLLQLLFPVTLLSVGLSYLPYVILQCLLTRLMFKRLMDPQRGLRTLAAHALLTFTIVGALFEPDFGSYFRHKVSVLPFLLLIVAEFEWMDRCPLARGRLKRHRGIAHAE